MPKQVFAEDIERLIGALEGVVAARVSTTPGGDIDQIYVMATSTADVRAVRRGIGTALVSTYGLPLEPWRVQIAQPRPDEGSPPRFGVLRIEEIVGAVEMTALVQLTWARGGEERVVTGRARGPLGPAHRLRTVASATLDGAREALGPGYRKAAAQEASLVTFFGRPTALVGISVATPRGEERAFGIAQEEASSDAIVLAALDAVTKLAGRAALAVPPADRRAVLEAMRRHVGSSERARTPRDHGAPPVPPHEVSDGAPASKSTDSAHPVAASPPAQSPGGVADPAHGGFGPRRRPGTGPAVGTGPEAHRTRAAHSVTRMYFRPASAAAERASGASPVESRNGEILAPAKGPEPGRITQPAQEGVVGMAAHQDVPQTGRSSSGSGRLSIEEVLYQSLIANRTPVHVRCRDGYELRRAVLKDVGTESVLLEVDGDTELVYKHAILSIRPLMGPRAGA